MKRFTPTHYVVINFLLDGKWHKRRAIEQVVFDYRMNMGASKPNHRSWKAGTTMCLKWLVNSGWASVEMPDGPGTEQFKITSPKRKVYKKWKECYERDIANGRVDEFGSYYKGRGPMTAKIRDAIRNRTGTYRG